MRKPEQRAWDMLRPILDITPNLEFERVENKVSRGTPDIDYAIGDMHNGVHGWIELKAIEFPYKLSAKFDSDVFTDIQKHWLKTRGRIAGHCWVCFIAEETDANPAVVIFIDSTQIDDLIGASWETVLEKAKGVWFDTVQVKELAGLLHMKFGTLGWRKYGTRSMVPKA